MNALLDIPFDSPMPQRGVVKKLSQRHRALARLLAKGHSPGECCMILRLSSSWVSVIQSDPAFQEMVKGYSALADEEFRRTAEKLADLSEEVIDELHTRLEEAPNEFSASQLTELLKITADRSGHGPTSTQRNLHVHVSSAELDAIKEQVARDNTGLVEIVSSFDTERTGEAPAPNIRTLPAPAKEGDTKKGTPVSSKSDEGYSTIPT